MEPDSDLRKLFLHSVENNSDAVMTALDEKLITLEDIDEKNESHRHTVFDWAHRYNGGRVLLPARFITVGTVQEIGWLDTESNPNHDQAVVELIKRAKTGNAEALQHFIGYRSGRQMPMEVQTHFKSYFADPEQLKEGWWNNARQCLDPVIEREIVLLRASVKRKATVAQSAGQPKAAKVSDPLIAGLTANDSKRLAGLDLETLKPERWEKAKTLWLSSDVKLKAHLVRLPWALVKDNAAEALAASAEVEHDYYRDRTTSPNWPIPKEALRGLKTKALCYWLTKLVTEASYSSGMVARVRPRIGFKELVEDWGTLVMGAVLQGDEIGKVFEWSKHVEKFRRLALRLADKTLSVDGLSTEEKKMMAVVLSGMGITRGTPFLPLAMAEDCSGRFMDMFNWLFTRPDKDQLRFGKMLSEHKVFVDDCRKVFGKEGFEPVNFYLEGLEDPVKEVERGTQ